jgi:hypothetical protein
VVPIAIPGGGAAAAERAADPQGLLDEADEPREGTPRWLQAIELPAVSLGVYLISVRSRGYV